MPTLSITFNDPLNTSLQVGDVAYYVQTQAVGNFNTASQPNMVKIGEVINIIQDPPEIHIFSSVAPIPQPLPGYFIMFAKDSRVNLSGLVGYYAEVKIKNNSTEKAEMYSIASEITPSSK